MHIKIASLQSFNTEMIKIALPVPAPAEHAVASMISPIAHTLAGKSSYMGAPSIQGGVMRGLSKFQKGAENVFFGKNPVMRPGTQKPLMNLKTGQPLLEPTIERKSIGKTGWAADSQKVLNAEKDTPLKPGVKRIEASKRAATPITDPNTGHPIATPQKGQVVMSPNSGKPQYRQGWRTAGNVAKGAAGGVALGAGILGAGTVWGGLTMDPAMNASFSGEGPSSQGPMFG
jgi:hypothetical protein